MPPIRHESKWWGIVTRWFCHPAHSTVPALTTDEMVTLITAAAGSHIAAHTDWFEQRWSNMTQEDRMHWVDRRRAALMVVWVRGGDKGFEGLGKRLSEALQEIDYEPHCRSGR
jgi:hypothetical protein